MRYPLALVLVLFAMSAAASPPAPTDYFRITVVDEATSRGVPLIQLTAAGGVAHITDSAGVIAFHEPALMNRTVHFMVEGHGYGFRPDGFGMHGLTLKADAGSSAVVVVQRRNIAERLYRITGSGIYNDSVLLGDTPPIKEPLLNSGVIGQDSVMTTSYKGRLFWLWGDTSATGHPLSANFMTTCAWSDFPTSGGLDPDNGVNLEYISRKGFTKPMVDMPKGVYWMHSLLTVPAEYGRERMLAGYSKIRPPLSTDARGWMEYDDARDVFVPFREDDMNSLVLGDGHVFRVEDSGQNYFYFPAHSHFTRLPATYQDVKQGKYEAFTCLTEGKVEDATTTTIDRDEAGRLRYRWRTNAQPVGFAEQDKLTSAGLIGPDEQWFAFRDVNTGKVVRPHANTVRWNPHRNRWIMVFSEIMGSSMLGEIWYAEADTPTGPWAYATKIITHERYSLYNPYLHAAFDKDKGRTVYLEGTYTMGFSGTTVPTPRYDYNQVMYKLDLDDPRLNLPVAVYSNTGFTGEANYFTKRKSQDGEKLGRIQFYAQDRPSTYTVPLISGKGRLKLASVTAGATCHVIPSDSPTPPPGTVRLYEWKNDIETRYLTEDEKPPSGLSRNDTPLCRVWSAPAANTITH